MLIDTHAHLVSLDDFPAAIDRALENGVERIISMSTDLPSCSATVEIAREYECVYAACGIHPHSASGYSPEILDKIERIAGDETVVAVGETGLDYFYMSSPREIQIESLEAHIDLANRMDLPFVVHVRDADSDLLDVLGSASLRDKPGVIHCFTGDYEMARKYMNFGFFISFSGITTFKRSHEIREAATKIPFDRLLIETDSPYLAPVPVRGKKNEPANVRYVAELIANLRNVTLEQLSEQLKTNTIELFPGIDEK